MIDLEFEQLLRKYTDAIDNRSRLVGLIKDYFPGQQMQINLLLMAYDLGITKDIANTSTVNNAFAFRYVKRLMEEYGISRSKADWVVSVWCVCYGQRILGKPCEIQISSGKVGAAPVISESHKGTSQYGELFLYEKSSKGNGLSVTGFTGENQKTIIFQNRYRNQPVLEIKEKAFSESSIEEAIMTEGIHAIGARAFLGCTGLRQMIFPVTLKEIGDYALAGCESLKTISLPEMLEQIGAYAFSGTGLKNLQIPKSVYWIGEGALSCCMSMESIHVPENINQIPNKLFQDCANLRKVVLHEQLNAIGDHAFAECESLKEIYIPESVQNIGENAFTGVNEQFILMCSFGSYAESYARRKKLKFQFV